MSDVQLNLAIGIPAGLFALNLIAILWRARGLERSFNVRFDALDRAFNIRIDALERVMDANFAGVDAKFKAAQEGLLRVEQVLDARLKHLEER